MIVIDGMYRKVMGSDEINERFACLLDKEVQLISDDDDDEVDDDDVDSVDIIEA